MRIKYQKIDGAMTRYYEAGNGPSVLLLHGVGMPAEVWIRSIPALATRYHVVAPDLLGCGFTERGRYREGPLHPDMLDHLFELMDTLELSKVASIGSSLGALLAIHMHLRAPQRVPCLTLVSSGSAFNTDSDLKKMYEATWKNGRSVYLDPSKENCVRRMRAIVSPETEIPEELLTAQMSSYPLPGAMEIFENRMKSLIDIDSWQEWRVQPQLQRVSAKVLAIFGGQDPRANLESARDELRKIPGSRLSVFPSARHYPQLDDTARFNKELLGFLNEAHFPDGT